ncbi:MAG TPA: hypothetical protein VI300_25370 [Solirubrobacter sp.]
MAIYDAMDGPTYASLRPAVRVRQIAGWAFLAVAVLGLLAILAMGDTFEALAALPMAALFGGLMWRLMFRTSLRTGLAAPTPATDQATYEPAPRLLRVAALMSFFVLGGAVCVALGSTPPAFVPLGFALAEFAAAAKLRAWERRNGRTLFTAGRHYFAR